jgi:transaldolase
MTTANDRLTRLGQECGQAPWLDSISRDWLESGELDSMRDRLALRGVTSNPSIFQAALRSTTYDADVRRLADEGLDDRQVFHRLATDDIRAACDHFEQVHEATGDGYVSIEVDPDLAHDTDATVAQARDLWATVRRPNLMVKIQHPGDRGRPPRDRAGRERGHQRQRHAALRRRGLLPRARGVAARARAAPRRRW